MKPFYTIDEVADLLNVKNPTVYSYADRGLIKRIEDPHRLHRSVRFDKESVDRLAETKQAFEQSGSSLLELAHKYNVYPAKIKEAFEKLELDVQTVKSSFQRSAYRYAITEEQETAIARYLQEQKPARPRKNRLYLPLFDTAFYQAFQLAGEQQVRFRQHPDGRFGFYLEDGRFLTYETALQSYELEPRYLIHQKKQAVQKGFTDFTIPLRSRAAYQALDALYAVCGVENFNAEIAEDVLHLSVRSGYYPKNSFATAEALTAVKRFSQNGTVEQVEDQWVFTRQSKTVTLQLEGALLAGLERLAGEEGKPVKEWIEKTLREKVKATQQP